jgi:porin
MKFSRRFCAIILMAVFCPPAFSQAEASQDPSAIESRSPARAAPQTGARFGGPTSVQEELEEDRIDTQGAGLDRWNGWKDDLYQRYGLKFSIEYNSLMQWLSPSAIDEDSFGGGNARLFGSWTLLGKDTQNPGSLVFRVDNRHAYTDLDPQNGSLAAG